MPFLKRVLLIVVGSLITTHVFAGDSMGFWEMIKPPLDISTHGIEIDKLFNYATLLNVIFFILLCIGLIGFTFYYHHKRHPKPEFTYGNKKIHNWVVLAIGIAVFFGIDLSITTMSNEDLTKIFWNWPDEKQEEVVRIEIMAQQWMWNFRYAGKDGVFNTADDITTNNDLRIPAGKKIMVQVTSKDVIHSFSLPNVRLKVDAIPGRVTRMWFDANTPGKYPVVCAEMCGIDHYLMEAHMTVHTQEDFDKWLEQSQTYAISGNDTENPDAFWGWKWENN